MRTISRFFFDSQLVSFDEPKSIEFDGAIILSVESLEDDMLNPGGLIAGGDTNIVLISSNGSTTSLAGKKC